jgi:hypothetical protein
VQREPPNCGAPGTRRRKLGGEIGRELGDHGRNSRPGVQRAVPRRSTPEADRIRTRSIAIEGKCSPLLTGSLLGFCRTEALLGGIAARYRIVANLQRSAEFGKVTYLASSDRGVMGGAWGHCRSHPRLP